jgi:hypothetical protein
MTRAIPRISRRCRTSTLRRFVVPVVPLLLVLLLTVTWIPAVRGIGGELMAYTTTPLDKNVTHRQNVCDRYEKFREGKVELRLALEGLKLKPLIRTGDYFHYDAVTGIDRADPGLMADLLDEVARRAGFTWRDSFGVQVDPVSVNMTFTEMLLWTVENFDIAINWWDQSVERMEKGVAYIEPWFDGSVILINQREPVEDSTNAINLLNWLRPFEMSVWLLICATILLSGLVYQFIEFLHHERESRPWYQWLSDNLYLSAMNFTQNYQYAPNCFAGRIYGVSMGIWALVMTATYTANLASLFVEQGKLPLVVDTIDQAIALQIPICTYRNTNADFLIRQKFPNALRVPKVSELEAYQALRRGECGLVAGYKDNWFGYRGNSQYNPDCDLEWVGRTVEVIKSGFAVKADAGYLCTSLIRDVVNLHLTEVISDGVLADAWERHRAKRMDINCDAPLDAPTEEDDAGRRQRRRQRRHLQPAEEVKEGTAPPPPPTWLRTSSPDPAYRRPKTYQSHQPWKRNHRLDGRRSNYRRHLNTEGGSTTESTDPSSSSLTLTQMLGCFVLHWAMMTVAVIVAAISSYMSKRDMLPATTKEGKVMEGVLEPRHHPRAPQRVSIIYRKHGPIIGAPPPINTSFVIHSNDRISNAWINTIREDDDDISFNETDSEFIQAHYGGSNSNNGTAPSTAAGGQPHGLSKRRSSSGTIHRGAIERNGQGSKDMLQHRLDFRTSPRASEATTATTQSDWRESHMKLQDQMTAVVTMLQEMRREQQQPAS